MVKIYMIGLNHFDPFGPDKVQEVIKDLLKQGVVFERVYTEWDEETANSLLNERESFRRYLVTHVKDELNVNTIEYIVRALAYEADVFSSLIPDAKIIWMDEGRKIESLEGYFKFRLDVVMQEFAFTRTDPNNLETLSEYLWSISMSDEKFGKDEIDRNKVLFNRIIESRPNLDSSILVLIGASHAMKEKEGSTAQLLFREGYPVTSINLYHLPTPRTVDPNATSADV